MDSRHNNALTTSIPPHVGLAGLTMDDLVSLCVRDSPNLIPSRPNCDRTIPRERLGHNAASSSVTQ